MYRLKIVVFACFLIVVLAGVFSQRHALACEAVGFIGYKQVAPNVFVSPSVENIEEALRSILDGRPRVGWLTHWLEIPVWFNEGMALIVDHREPFLIENIDISQAAIDSVKQLKTGRAFFGGKIPSTLLSL